MYRLIWATIIAILSALGVEGQSIFFTPKDGIDYSGIYKWNDVVQIRSMAFDSVQGKLSMSTFSIANDLVGLFVVQSFTMDPDSKDTLVIIKYLYYLDDRSFGRGTTITNETYFYRYNYNGSPAKFDGLSKKDKIQRNFGVDQIYFTVPRSIFRTHATKVTRTRMGISLGFGVINYPFKYRPQKGEGDFSGSFNVGAAIALTLPHDSLAKWIFSYVAGFGISSITLDKSQVSMNANKLDSTNGLTALSLSLGYMVEYNKVQAGIFVGWDRLNNLNNSTYGWKYQGRPWLSVGIGYSIFSTSGGNKQSTTDTQSK
jgi:hypothetical protein